MLFYTHFISCGLEKKENMFLTTSGGKYDGYSDHQTLSESSVVHDLKFSFL